MSFITEILWGYHVLALIVLVGVKLSFETNFFQIRNIKKWILIPFEKTDTKKGISGFSAISTALAGSIGTGNIIGVSLAISIGGAGSIFWMWISSLFGMMTVFAEIALSKKYESTGVKVGAFTYIEKLCKGKILAKVYAVGCILVSLAMGNMAQSSSFTAGVKGFGFTAVSAGLFLAFTMFFLAKKGITLIAKVTEVLVPLMTIIFLAISLVLLFLCKDNLTSAIEEIISGAFSIKAGLGAGMFLAIKTGVSRSVFTNEAGLGLSSMVFSKVKGKSAKQLGYFGIFQVFMDTTVMCTITGLCILCGTELRQGSLLVSVAFENTLGSFGLVSIQLSMILFAFATMTATCFYGKVGLAYLSKNKLTHLFPYLFSVAALLGAVVPVSTIFDVCDAFNGLLAIPNIIALSFFLKEIVEIAKE